MDIVEIRIKNFQRALNDKASGNQTELGRLIGKRQSYVSDLLAGKKSFGEKVARDIERKLGLDGGWLDRGGFLNEAQSKHEKSFESNVTEGPAIQGRVPLISWVQAGDAMEVVDLLHPGEGYEWIEATCSVKNHTYALRVEGDSMSPRFPPGTILIVEPEMDFAANYFVIAKNGGNEATFKQIVKDGGKWLLKPINPQYPTIEFIDEWRIIGVVRRAIEDLA